MTGDGNGIRDCAFVMGLYENRVWFGCKERMQWRESWIYAYSLSSLRYCVLIQQADIHQSVGKEIFMLVSCFIDTVATSQPDVHSIVCSVIITNTSE